MDIVIRQAKPDDWKIVQKLNHEVFEHDAEYDKYLDVSWPFSEEGIERYKEVVSSPEYCTFIAYAGDLPVGHIAGGPKKINYRRVSIVEIYEIGVSAEYRSSGVGSKLVNALKKWSQDKGYQKMTVNCYAANEKTIAFYKKQGLQPIDIDLEMSV